MKKKTDGGGKRYLQVKTKKQIVDSTFFLVGVFPFNLSVRIFHHVNMCHLIDWNIKQVTCWWWSIPSHHIPPPPKNRVRFCEYFANFKKLNLQCPEALTSPMIAFQRCASGSSCAWYMWGNSANALIQAVESFWKPSKEVNVTKSSNVEPKMLFWASKPPNWWGSSEIVMKL